MEIRNIENNVENNIRSILLDDVKSKNGITLIALIITIILMLILSGIVISLTLGDNGIFKLAKVASKNYINAAGDEEKEVNNLQNNIDNILNDDNKKYPTLASKVSVGDYVSYNPTKGVTDSKLLTYTSPVGTGMSHGNGCSKTDDNVDLSNGQTFTANSNIKWRVLSKNNETGEVVLISESPIQTDDGREFYISGAIGYLYAEQELNEICKIYGYGKGADTSKEFRYETGYIEEERETGTIKGSAAKSIDVNDINTITGYKPAARTSATHTIFYPTKTTEDGKSITTKTTTDENTENYYGTDYLSNSSAIYKMLFTNETNSNYSKYWLANRCKWDSENGGVNFFVQMLWDGKVGKKIVLGSWTGEWNVYVNSGLIRPIVYLKTNLQTTGQDENGVWMLAE